jgi:hypothetical protein
MSTTEYNEVASLMRGEGRPLFDRLTIQDIVFTETNLNLDSLISEMRELPNIEVDAFESSVINAYSVWGCEKGLSFLYSVIPELTPYVGTTSFEERSYEILGKYDVYLNIYEIYILHNFTSLYASLFHEVPQYLFCHGIPLCPRDQELLIKHLEGEGKVISTFYKRILNILSRSYREYWTYRENLESSMTPSAPVSSEIDDIFSNMQM